MKFSSFAASLVLLFAAKCTEATKVERVDVRYFSDPYDELVGDPVQSGVCTATLYRSPAGIGFHLETHSLPRGAYTIWYMIYNNVKGCQLLLDTDTPVGDCDLNDAFDPNIDSGFAAIRVSHDVVDDSGTMVAEGFAAAGEHALEPGSAVLEGSFVGELTKPMTAEVHIILKYHGEPLPLGNGEGLASLEAQLHDVQGGCQYYRENGGMEPAPIQLPDGFELCPDPQTAIFPGK